MVVGVLLQQCEHACTLSRSIVVNVMSFTRHHNHTQCCQSGALDYFFGGSQKRHIARGIIPYYVGEDGAPGSLMNDEVLQLHLEGFCHAPNSRAKIQEVVLEVIGLSEGLTHGDLMINIAQHVEHLIVVRHIRAQA